MEAGIQNPKNFTSIWREDIEAYIIGKTVFSVIISFLYPFSFFCVLKKSPQSFGSLKWFLLFHLICISIAWIANFILIDYFYFVPSLVLRIDGILIHWIDSFYLYQISYIFYGCSLASSQLIFCNRVFLIMNMYKSGQTRRQQLFEAFVYFLVGLMALGTVPVVWEMTPIQEKAKRAIIQNYKVYPECVYQEQSVIVCHPLNNCAINFAIMNISNVIISTGIIFTATHMAYRLLSKRMMMKSEKTKKMHKKFNRRTFLQAFTIFTFSNIPILIANLALLLELDIPDLSYLVDFLRENQPNASLLTLFLFYEPYQLYLIAIMGYCRKSVGRRIVKIKSARPSSVNVAG